MAISEDASQKAAEQEVQRYHDALGPFVVAAETTRMAMLFTNAQVPNHPIIFANDSFVRLLGYDREEILGRDFDFFFSQPGTADGRKRIELATADDTGPPLEVECRRKDGSVFPAACFISPVRDAEGNVVQIFSSFVDLTAHYEHTKNLARLLSVQADLVDFGRVSAMATMATTLAHELNQPLTAIANYAAGCRHLLATEAPSLAEIGRDIAAIEDSALRAGKIMRRLRNMSQGGPPQREVFDLHDAIRESLELVRAGACDGVELRSDAKGSRTIEADRTQIQQVIINLVRNGCEAAAGLPDARVSVTTAVHDEKAIVSVDDTGPGISPGRSPDPFVWATSDKPEGMGVGLSISRTIIEAHGGEIWLSTGDRGQTQFHFSLPLGASNGGEG